MASAHIVFGKIKVGHPIMSNDFTSQLVASTATSSTVSGYNIAGITAVGASMYAALGNSSPSAASHPRLYVANGTTIWVSIEPDTLINVQDV